MRSFKAESILASTIAAAAILFYSGAETFRMLGDTPTRSPYGRGHDEGLAAVERQRERESNLIRLGLAQIGLGGVLLVGSIGVGIAIAYGIGPKWLTYRISGRIEGRYVFSEGSTHPDGDPHLLGGRSYVAVWSADDQTLHELWCPPDLYRQLRPGQRVECRAIGRRLTRVDRVLASDS
ncbi:MAG: hypothetical protein SNJ76_06715 [Fimbriimonadaceae bacterium]